MNYEELLKKWKLRLGLAEWTIALRPESIPDDFTLQNVAGETEWTESNK